MSVATILYSTDLGRYLALASLAVVSSGMMSHNDTAVQGPELSHATALLSSCPLGAVGVSAVQGIVQLVNLKNIPQSGGCLKASW
jgi:hypothetical protein